MASAPHQVSEAQYTVRAAVRVLDLLDFLQDGPEGAGLAEVAAELALPKSSAFRYLSTLEARGYVERDEHGHYRIGRAFMPSHTRYLETLAAKARPFLEGLRDRFGETINLGVLDRDRVAYLEIVESHRAVRLAARIGDRDPIHSTALGKAIASTLPAERVLEILRTAGMPQRTARTIIDSDAYLSELAETRERGYAVDHGENEDDGRCVAVPIVGVRVHAALSLSAPSFRFPVEGAQHVAAALAEVAARIADPATERPVPRGADLRDEAVQDTSTGSEGGLIER